MFTADAEKLNRLEESWERAMEEALRAQKEYAELIQGEHRQYADEQSGLFRMLNLDGKVREGPPK